MNQQEIIDQVNAKMESDRRTRYSVAKKTGISRTTLGRYLDSKNEIPLDRLLLICKEVGVPVTFG